MARVLVIDYDRETRETLEEQLRRAGHGVQTTAAATDGVRLAREPPKIKVRRASENCSRRVSQWRLLTEPFLGRIFR